MNAIHNTQIFSPFGGGYISESHISEGYGGGSALHGLEQPSLAGWATVLGALLIGATMAAAFTTAQAVAAALI
jgi:hypothetical protein